MPMPNCRPIAFYLPQFHPIPENDQWWGKGFTEWTNVTRSQALFRSHYQPHLPGELGFYDLRLTEAREQQAALAREYGIEGFCYWHYWFHGRRLLERPFNEVLSSRSPDFPFCLAWANESWSRSWLGDERQILAEQVYSPEDDAAHARWLTQAFADKRYIRVHGRPLFLVYRPSRLPSPQNTIEIIRKECERAGLPSPYMVGINAHAVDQDMRNLGFDMTENHAPQLSALPGAFGKGSRSYQIRRFVRKALGNAIKVYDYREALERMAALRPKHPHFPAFFVGWDNSPRRGKEAIVITGSTPDRVKAGLTEVIASVREKPFEERIIFLNAWNEWAEGMHLEPDQMYGRGVLEAVAAAVRA